jgi:gluconokinase
MSAPLPPFRHSEPQHLVVMGVSGSGKTTLAARLAAHLLYAFADADEFHSPQNVAKMARGEPLTDADRAPWLHTLAEWLAQQHAAGRSSVLACSALKRRYRDTLRGAAPLHVFFIHVDVPREALLERLRQRVGHYMPPELLDSQLAALEPLQPDERGIVLDATAVPDTVVERALALAAQRLAADQEAVSLGAAPRAD